MAMPSAERIGRFEPAVADNVARAVRALGERLGSRFGSRFVEVRLFGSHARGEQHDESDVDVLVLFEEDGWDEAAVFLEVARVDVAERVWLSPLLCSRGRFEAMLRDEVGIALEIQAEGIRV
jgi:predicted nucleotidyltransferase